VLTQQKEAGPSLRSTHAHFAKSSASSCAERCWEQRSSLIMDGGDYTLITLTLLQQHGCRSPSPLLAGRTGGAFVRRASGVDWACSIWRTKREHKLSGPVEKFGRIGNQQPVGPFTRSPWRTLPRGFVISREDPSSWLYRSGATPLAPLFFCMEREVRHTASR
jgi:hypothetical protein